ncbi:HAD-IA family hydrolase [Paracidobacterium acidisoli]|uniref:HAD family hydrolase n=1 Tax=Paracidobacterium acidisoli TaxID=2303751 RepID=A0A372IP76_9BACT|nr:HAD-IA family hydrolase [Paracidobacterium acidisoli]MBT9331075.1 HAD-IA family hydrolase [Paracidobacterium acidisoli]
MSEISTILWDVGGVFLTNGWDHHERAAVLAQFGLDRDAFEQRHTEPNDAWEKSLITVEEYLDRTVFYEPRSFTHSDFIEAMKAQSKVLEDSALGILRELAASEETELGVLNNEARELNDFRLEEFGLLSCLDVFFSSCYVGLRKPDAKFYRLALDVLQRDPDNVVFIDDRAENAAAAAAEGMHAIRYEGSRALRNELARLGVSIERN